MFPKEMDEIDGLKNFDMTDIVSPAGSASVAEPQPSMKKLNLKIVTEFPENSTSNDIEHAHGQTPSATATPGSLCKRRRNLPGTPDPTAEVVALSPEILMAANRYVCEVCHKGFQRDQNLQLHRRGHNLPWKLRQRSTKESRKKVYICPEPSCIHHSPARALGDLTGIKKHFSRKHGKKKYKCSKCSKMYAVLSDCKAHMKVCGTKEYRCDCGTLFSRRDSFVTHRAFCESLNLQRLLHQASSQEDEDLREGTPSPKEAILKQPSGDMEEVVFTPASRRHQQSLAPSAQEPQKELSDSLETTILQAALLIQQNKGLLGTDLSTLSGNLMSLGIDVEDMAQLSLLVNVLTALQQQQKQTPSQPQQQQQQQQSSDLFSHLFGTETKPNLAQISAPKPSAQHSFSSPRNNNHQRTLSSISDIIASFLSAQEPSVKAPSFPSQDQHLDSTFSFQVGGMGGKLTNPLSFPGLGSLVPPQKSPASPLGSVTTQQLQEISRMSDQQSFMQNLERQLKQQLQQAELNGGFTRDYMGVLPAGNFANYGGLADMLR